MYCTALTGTTQFTIPKKKYANFCSRDRNWLAGWSISLPVTEIGWLAPRPRFLWVSLVLYIQYISHY